MRGEPHEVKCAPQRNEEHEVQECIDSPELVAHQAEDSRSVPRTTVWQQGEDCDEEEGSHRRRDAERAQLQPVRQEVNSQCESSRSTSPSRPSL